MTARRQTLWTFAITSVALFMATLDNLVVTTALPVIRTDLHASLEDPALNSMNFLNEIAGHYPDAISLAAGRPYEENWSVDDLPRYLNRFSDHLRHDRGYSEEKVRTTLFQYGRTKGIIHDLIARMLLVDEGVDVDPESIVVTVGAQEAIYLVLRALRRTAEDVALYVRPAYVGFTGAARLADMRALPVPSTPEGIDLDALRTAIGDARASGARPRVLYVTVVKDKRQAFLNVITPY